MSKKVLFFFFIDQKSTTLFWPYS